MRFTDTPKHESQCVGRSGPFDYHFASQWRLESDIDSVASAFLNTEMIPRWWADSFFSVVVKKPGTNIGLGRVIELKTRGWLPYFVRFQLKVVEVRYPEFFCVKSTGDIEGMGSGTLKDFESFVTIDFDWRVRAQRPLLKWLSPLAKPILRSNHYWMMNRGQDSLNRMLQGNADASIDDRITTIAGFRFAQRA